MASKRELEQHIAVFGETGSGKTVLLSSFYGAMQEPAFLRDSLFWLIADDPGQSGRLHQNYLGMKNSGMTPPPTRLKSASYAFSVKLKRPPIEKKSKSTSFDVLRLVWHDYPGEWFERDPQGPEETGRRLQTFRSLLASDVALLLVDGARLREEAGHEAPYLKALLTSFRNGITGLRDDLLPDGEPLARFPRI